MNPKYRLIVLSTLVILTIIAYLFYRSQTSAELMLYGNVDVRTVHLSFRVGGQLKELYVDEGDTVTKGQLLASLDNEPYLYAQERAKGVKASAFARLNMMENGYRQEEIAQIASEVNQRKAALEYAQSFYRRQQTLSQQRATSLNELEEAKNYLNQASAALTASQDKLRLYQSGFRPEEIDAAKGEWHQAEASLQQAELDLKDTELIAPSHGTILTRTVEPGTIVNAGQTIFTLTLTDPVWVRAYISETNLGRAIPGSELLLYTDSQPNKPYHGTIGFVSPTAEFTPKNVETPELRSNLVYRLRIIVTDADDALRQGMPVTIRWP